MLQEFMRYFSSCTKFTET